ncbi:MAG: lysylphosphatidylglycerol synthase transmembrane domain-containing protein [Phycisphaerales bacterium]|jgi:uncharacterized membrane protein YbhN (UPF0104 family)
MSHQSQSEGVGRLGRYAALALGCVLFVMSLVVLASSHRLDQLPFVVILISQPAMILSVVLIGIRLAMLFPNGARPYRSAVSATFIGGGFGIMLPFRAGEALKLLVLRKQTGTKISTLLGVILLERAGDVLVLAFFGTIVLLGKTNLDQLLILVIFVVCFLFVRPIGKSVGLFLKGQAHTTAQSAGEWIRTASSRCTARGLAWSSLTSLPGQALAVGVALVVMHAIAPEETTVRAGIALWFGAAIGLGLSLAPAGLGTFEAGGTAALMALGWPLETALEATVSLHIAYLITLAPIGGLLVGFQVPSFFRPRARTLEEIRREDQSTE